MRTAPSAVLLCLALAALSTTRAGRAEQGKPETTAAASDEASRRFKSGVAFYKDKDFPAALVEFKRAYELVPNYSVLYNLGQTARELRDYAAALGAFEQYLRDGGAKIAAPRRKEVDVAIDELRRKVGRIKVVINLEGAEIAVDDLPAGVSPLADPVVVNVGRRRLSVRASGVAPVQRLVDVASMEETTVTLELTKVDASPPRIEPPPPPLPPKPAPSILPWVTLSAAAACAVGAGVTGGLALSARASLKDALATFPGDAKAIESAQGRTRTFAITADVLGGIAAAGAVTTVILFAIAPRAAEKAKAAVAVSPTGLVVRGVF